MKPKFILLPFVVVTASIAIAQDQAVISAAGDYNQKEKISLEWTVGETTVETINSGNSIYTQGFHQPLLIKKTPQIDLAKSALPDYLFTIAPNPVISELTVAIDKGITSKVQLQLTDLRGRTLSLFAPSYNRLFKISFRNQPAGIYHITIRNEKAELLKKFFSDKITNKTNKMKQIIKYIALISVILSAFTNSIFSQTVPAGMKYQAVARDLKGDILANQKIALQISLQTGEEKDQVVHYKETHEILTSPLGLFTLVIGEESEAYWKAWQQELYEVGIKLNKDSLQISVESKKIMQDSSYRRLLYPASYSWEKAVEFLNQAEVKKAFWYFIKLFGQDSANRRLVIESLIPFDKVLEMDKVLISTFYTYALLDPKICSFKNNRILITQPDVLEKEFSQVKEIIGIIQAFRKQVSK